MTRRNFEVFRGSCEVPVFYAKRKVAREWLERGLAELIGENQIRMVDLNREVVRTSDCMLSSGQDAAYELAAIEPHRNFVQGGGVNGKHRQFIYKPLRGAKVGHQ